MLEKVISRQLSDYAAVSIRFFYDGFNKQGSGPPSFTACTDVEEVTYAVGDNNQAMVGHSFDFTWKIEDGKWRHVGTLRIGRAAQSVDEIWEPAP
jgi:hypothetical protein